jgi:hypothetical protein
LENLPLTIVDQFARQLLDEPTNWKSGGMRVGASGTNTPTGGIGGLRIMKSSEN